MVSQVRPGVRRGSTRTTGRLRRKCGLWRNSRRAGDPLQWLWACSIGSPYYASRFSGHPKGFAYIEFSGQRFVLQSAIGLDETLLRGRVLKVMPKRTNMPVGPAPPTLCPTLTMGPPAGKRQWGPPEYREQTSKRYPCLLLITPPSEEGGPGPSGHHYPQQR
ncbi:unnamed protein product [Arctogadus glacialis]